MKTKKLDIKKETIVNLDRIMLNSAKGGFTPASFTGYACTSREVDRNCPWLIPPHRDTE
jgi:hypothetical protein